MENFKVYVKNDAESGSVQDLLSSLGFKWMSGDDRVYFDTPNYIMAWEGRYMTVGDVCDSKIKEVAIDKLCDLVDSKKNSENGKEMNILDEGRYVEKEYINKTTGEYRKTADVVSGEQWVEVPSGATAYTEGGGFYKEGGKYIHLGDNKWDCWGDGYLSAVVWQRPTQPEALPFVDDETSLNDQYAEIEKVFQKEKHSHYKKDVSGFDFVDVYRVLKLFEVADPCLQHAVKKLLCSGQRGVKSVDKDIQEAIDSLLRYQEMKKEDLK